MEPGATANRTTGSVGRPRALVAGLVALEALAVLAGGVYLAVETVVSTALERDAAIVQAVLVLVLGLGLGYCVTGVLRGRRWSRAPVFTWQLLQVSLAVPMFRSGWAPVGVVALLVAAFVGYMMLGSRVVARGD